MQINFENACKGNETDLVKILIALMGLYSLTVRIEIQCSFCLIYVNVWFKN